MISYPIRHLRPPSLPPARTLPFRAPCSRHPQLPAASGGSYALDTHTADSEAKAILDVTTGSPTARTAPPTAAGSCGQALTRPLCSLSIGPLVGDRQSDPRLHKHQQAAADRALNIGFGLAIRVPRSSSKGSLTAWQASATQRPSRLSASGDADGAGAASNEDMNTHMQRAERRVNAAPSGGGRGWVSGWFGRQVCFRTLKRPFCNCQLCDV